MKHARCALGIVSLSLASAWAAAPSDPAERARAILHDDRCQTELPFVGGPEPPTGAAWAAEPASPLPPPIHIPGLSTLALLAAVVLIAVVLAFLVKRLAGRSVVEDLGPSAPAPASAERPAHIDNAETLAQAGRFAEAIHALLLAALRELARRDSSPAASPAATSREVLRSASLAAEAKAALAPLVAAVESIHFGRGSAGLEEYAGCAATYRQFRRACRLPA
jgi:hypothetical protein